MVHQASFMHVVWYVAHAASIAASVHQGLLKIQGTLRSSDSEVSLEDVLRAGGDLLEAFGDALRSVLG